MTKKAKSNRFDYAIQNVSGVQASTEASNSVPVSTSTPAILVLITVARGSGRMAQDREQLNVRLPTQLKRRALSAAALEGLTVGELIERLLLAHLEVSG